MSRVPLLIAPIGISSSLPTRSKFRGNLTDLDPRAKEKYTESVSLKLRSCLAHNEEEKKKMLACMYTRWEVFLLREKQSCSAMRRTLF